MLKRVPKNQIPDVEDETQSPRTRRAKLTKAYTKVSSSDPKGAKRVAAIEPPKMDYAFILIRGTTPLVLNNFSQKAKNQIMETQLEGSRSRKGKKREPKDFDAVFQGARHLDVDDGWDGFPASAIRNGMISACRLVGFTMTLAKLSVFVDADGF